MSGTKRKGQEGSFVSQQSATEPKCSLPPTQPAGKLLEGDQVVPVRGQQVEGAVGERVRVMAGPGRPRRQQPVEAFELRPVQSILPLHERVTGVAVLPGRGFCRRGGAAVAPVQGDKVLRLQGGAEEMALFIQKTSEDILTRGGTREYLKEVVQVGQILRRDGDVRRHQAQLHGDTHSNTQSTTNVADRYKDVFMFTQKKRSAAHSVFLDGVLVGLQNPDSVQTAKTLDVPHRQVSEFLSREKMVSW